MLGQINTFPHNGHEYVLVEREIAIGQGRYAKGSLYDLFRIDVKWGMKKPVPVYTDCNIDHIEEKLIKLFGGASNRDSRSKARQALAIHQEAGPVRKPAADPNRKFGQGLPTRSLAASQRTLVSA